MQRIRTVLLATLLVVAVLAGVAPAGASAAPAAGDPPERFEPLTTSRDEAFVIAAHVDFLDRYPTQGEIDDHTAVPLGQVAARRGIVTDLANSDEWVRAMVQRFYDGTLGRVSDDGGLEYWTGQIRSEKRTVAQVAAYFYASGEFFGRFAGGDVEAWVGHLYRELLLRDPANDADGVAYWVDETAARNRNDVAFRFYQTDESRRTRVELLYQLLLGRSGDAGGLDHWAAQIRTKGDIALAAKLAESAEYYERAWLRYGIEVPATEPGAPTDVVAVAGDGQASLNWMAPGDDGGSPITGYVVTPYVGGVAQQPLPTGATSTAFTIPGLTNGTEYSFTVAAVNDVGTGPDSAMSNAVTPEAPVVAQSPRVQVGTDHSCVLLDDGRVRCWGANDLGQLGIGSAAQTPDPVHEPQDVVDLDDATQLVVGYKFACAVREDTSVVCWGSNSGNQLATPDIPGSTVPRQIDGITGVVQIEARNHNVCVLLEDGTIRCWGYNYRGALGDGTTDWRPDPVEVVGLTGVESIGVGNAFGCAVLADTTVVCWGENHAGQVGDGTTDHQPTPTVVDGLSGVVQVAGGHRHACALLEDATVTCWGENADGRLGDGTTTPSLVPVPVTGLGGVAELIMGELHSCALLSDGGLECWGSNLVGQLGDGTTDPSPVPVPIQGLSDVTHVSSLAASTCAQVADGGT